MLLNTTTKRGGGIGSLLGDFCTTWGPSADRSV
jgi:hypothetical protein